MEDKKWKTKILKAYAENVLTEIPAPMQDDVSKWSDVASTSTGRKRVIQFVGSQNFRAVHVLRVVNTGVNI